MTICCIAATLIVGHYTLIRLTLQKHEVRDLTPASFLSDRLAQAAKSEPHTTTAQSTATRQTVKTQLAGFSGELPHAREVIMRVSGSSAPSDRLTKFLRLEPGLQTTVPEPSFAADQQFHLVAN